MADEIAARRRLCHDRIDKEPPASRHRFQPPSATQLFTQMQISNTQSTGDISRIPQAQLPPRPTLRIVFHYPIIVQGPRVKVDAFVLKHRLINNPNLQHPINNPPLQHPGSQYNQWLKGHVIAANQQQIDAVTRNLEFPRRFLILGYLDLEDHQFVIAHIPLAYVTCVLMPASRLFQMIVSNQLRFFFVIATCVDMRYITSSIDFRSLIVYVFSFPLEPTSHRFITCLLMIYYL